jgi:SMI1 / KNR4 family (SUKH-1)
VAGLVWEVAAVRARLVALAGADRGLRRFGASEHRYWLRPVLPPAVVAAFESQHGVVLPAAYRSFLLDVGDGGAGPCYGIFPLSGAGMNPSELEERLVPGQLAAPFPHTSAWNPPTYLPANGRPGPAPLAPAGSDRPVPAAGTLSEDDYFDPRWTAGSMVIAHHGCGAFYRLVLTGPARGQIWFDDRAADGGLRPDTPDFAHWYLDWLNQSI